MILVDFNQIAIGSVMVSLQRGAELSEELVRHIILNQLRFYRSKFHDEYGELVICCDSKHYWRRDFFPNYKINRKREREATGNDWDSIFECIHKVRDELDKNFPYKVVIAYGAEADDIIATLTYDNAEEKHLILSSDKDFVQLHRRNVNQYSPVTKKFVKPQTTKEEYLYEHIMKGDRSDGIPNILSSDDTFVADKRQKPIRKSAMVDIIEALDRFPPEKVYHLARCSKDTWIRNWQRNQTLIDLTKIPNEISIDIRKQFKEANVADRSKLFNYFVQSGLTNLIDQLGDF